MAKGVSRPVIGTNLTTGEEIKFPSTAATGRAGFVRTLVQLVCNGERKTHKGYRWRWFDADS